ncbi:rhomboid family intramembrane serine protease [soil metagenome]
MNAESPVFRFQRWRAALPPALRILLTINAVGFVAWLLLRFSGTVSAFVLTHLALTPVIPEAFYQPWTFVTYAFLNLEGGLWGLIYFLFAMLWLYWMGRDYEEFYGSHRLFGLYIISAIGGGLLALGLVQILPIPMRAGPVLYGAMAPALAVLCCAATLNPNRGIALFLLGVIPLKWIAIGFVVLDFVLGMRPTHLGAALTGFMFGVAQLRGIDLAAWARPIFPDRRYGNSYGGGVMSAMRNWRPKKRAVESEVADSPRATRRGAAPAVPAPQGYSTGEVDRILDKISEEGLHSLTADERRVLDEYSRR